MVGAKAVFQDDGEPRTAELDHTGITVIHEGARAAYEWTAVSRCTFQQKLLLIWIAPATALAIPSRSFGSEAASMAALKFVRDRLSGAQAEKAGEAPASTS